MAVKIVSLGSKLGSGGTQDALLKQLMEQYGKQSTPKVGGLGRIMAPLSAIGSAIDAYHDARYEDKDAGILNVLKNYGKNLLQGVGTLATDTNYEKDQKMQGASELLDKLNPNFKRSGLGKSVLGRMGVDILAGLVTDPTTYFGFGAMELSDDVIRGGLEAAGVGGKTITKLLPTLTGGTMDDVVKTLSQMGKVGRKTGASVADNFYVSVVQNVGKGTAKSGALKLLGKTITQNPTAVKIAKGVVSPLGAASDAVGGLSKKLTPELRKNLLTIFDPVQGAIEQGKGKYATDLLKFNRESSSLYRGVFGELRDAGLIDKWNLLSADEKAIMAKNIEASRETAYKASQVSGFLERKDELRKALKSYTGASKVKELSEIYPEAQFGAKDILDLRGVKGRYHGTPSPIEQLLNPGEDVYTTGNIYGQGFYTTDSVDIAKGYAKNRGGILGLLKQGDQIAQENGVLYRIKELGKTKLFNMERPLTTKEREAIGDIVGGFTENEWPPKGASLRKVYDEIRGFDEPADEIQNYFERIKQSLQGAGYDGLSHTGGKLTGNKAHKVNIYWNPKEQVQLVDLIKGGKISKVSGQLDLDDARFSALKDIDAKNALLNKPLDDFYNSLDEEQKTLIDPLLLKLDALNGKKLTDKRFNKILDDVFGNQIDKKGQLLRLPDGLSDNAKGFLSDYFAFERGQTKRMVEAGVPTIDARKMGYISRDPIGYKPKLLKNTLEGAGLGDVYEKLMGNKKVIKELSDKDMGYVTKETLQKVLSENEFSAFKQYDPGMIGELISGGGANKKRIFETLEQAEAAGMVYGKNPLKNIYEQTVRQNEQLLAVNFAKEMVTDEKSFSKTAKGLMTTPVTIPGVGKFYTDKYMAKIAEDYVSKYTTEDGINKLLTGFDKIQSKWKKWVTGSGPNLIAYNLRNLIDDNIRVIVGGGDITHLPGDYELALDMFRYEDLLNKVGKKEALKQLDQSRAAKFLKSVGVKSDNPLDELWNRTIKGGVYSDTSKSLSEMSIKEPLDIQQALGLEKSKKLGQQLERTVDNVATLKGKLPRREQATRMAAYFNFWRKEGAESAGLDAVQNISFNYNELSKVEKDVLKRVIPFYGFVKNNLKFYLDLIKNNPERLSRYYNVYEGLKSGSQSAFGEDWEAMPDYVKETLSIPVEKTKEGELKYLSGLNLGIEGLGDIPFGLTDQSGLRNAAGNLSPELNMLIELISGKDLYKGEDILEDNQGYNYANRSGLLKGLMNYQKYPVELKGGQTYEKQTVAPEFKYLLENLPFISTLNTGAKRLSDLTRGDEKLEALTNMMFPARIGSSKVDDAKERIQKKKKEDLYRLLQKKGIADVYKSFYIPKGLREQLFK